MTIAKRPKTAIAIVCASALALVAPSYARADDDNGEGIKHVLLLSVDGMHEVDLQRYVKYHPTSAFARLTTHGVHFTNAHTSRPSDSFPGLLAFMTGGSPLSHGMFYDDSYDRTLFPPNSNCQGKPGTETL
jgi:predicted AlkP superfamily pyrophosphatase or phosphodiesterase